MRWLIDEMLPPATAELLNDCGHDVVSVHNVGLTGAADPDVFDHAVADQRLVVTENFADFPLLPRSLFRTAVARGTRAGTATR